jgi:BolA protein
MATATIERMRELLAAALAPTLCEIEDESHRHAGHAGAASGGGHYRLRLVSARFRGLSPLARHRLVYDSLAALMTREIHALTMTLLAPEDEPRA